MSENEEIGEPIYIYRASTLEAVRFVIAGWVFGVLSAIGVGLYLGIIDADPRMIRDRTVDVSSDTTVEEQPGIPKAIPVQTNMPTLVRRRLSTPESLDPEDE